MTERGSGENITGRIYGRLTILSFVDVIPRKGQVWLARCKCGDVKEYIKSNLTRGHTQSCGCLAKEMSKTIDRSGNTYRRNKAGVPYPKPKLSIEFVETAWFWFDGFHKIATCPDQLFRAAVIIDLSADQMGQEFTDVLCKKDLGVTERWWLLLELKRKGREIRLYSSKQEAEAASISVNTCL